MSVKLNIGAGPTRLEGFIPIDRKLGTEAYPLQYADESVDEIRASHILEHFSFADAQAALREWTRVLKPGGRIRIAVPDLNAASKADPDEWPFIVMGGQLDADDFHRSAWNETRLRANMEMVGLRNVQRWQSPNTDTAAHPCSLNLEGFKPAIEQPATEQMIKVGAYLTLPRYEAVVSRNIIEQALKPLGITLVTSQGVFWGQCMQRMFRTAAENGLDWILSLDSDSLFSAEQLSDLIHTFAQTPEADAMAALQCRRGSKFPLMTTGPNSELHIEVDGKPIKVTTAHFGLTLIRVESLKKISKPWFFAEPSAAGEWDDDKLDDDIWFWHQWRKAGNTIYVAPNVSIGHLEETVACFDDHFQPQHLYVTEWRKRNLKE
jgi:hypothetical protein